jgi:hypothetical protein
MVRLDVDKHARQAVSCVMHWVVQATVLRQSANDQTLCCGNLIK